MTHDTISPTMSVNTLFIVYNRFHPAMDCDSTLSSRGVMPPCFLTIHCFKCPNQHHQPTATPQVHVHVLPLRQILTWFFFLFSSRSQDGVIQANTR